MDNKYYKLAIIGGGAAGLLAGISASEKISGKDIIIIEKNRVLGRKVLATGNGRCNFSNLECKWDDYAKNGKDLVKAVFNIMDPKETVKYFESLGIYARVDEEGRLYPYSLEASSLVKGLIERLKENQVNIELNVDVKSVEKTDKGFEIKWKYGSIVSEKLIIATGGKAGLRFGSSGDGYGFVKKLGHNLVTARPALVKIVTKEGKKENIKGVRVKGRVKLYLENVNKERQIVSSEIGEIQFYEEGLTGISIFQLSRFLGQAPEKYTIGLDLFPELEINEVMKLLFERKNALPSYNAYGLLRTVIPEKLIPVYLKEAGIQEEEKIFQIQNEKIKVLVGLLKEKTYRVKDTKGWEDAQVTAGGIEVSEITKDTLESLVCPGLFLAGELIDVDGPCGGWNLQWAWSSGYVAGDGAAIAVAKA